MRFFVQYASMNSSRNFFLFLLLAWGSFATVSNAQSIEKEILSLTRDLGIPDHRVGFVVQPVNQDNPVVLMEPDTYFSPASTAKLLTSWLALQKWGSAHQFETRVKQYKKSLCIEGGGDPALVHEHVFLMAEQVAKKIDGPIEMLFVDDAKLPATRAYAHEFQEDFQRAFTAPISALSMNYNAITVEVRGVEGGKKPLVQITPDVGYVRINNNAKSSRRTKNLRVEVTTKPDHMVVNVSGQVSSNFRRTYYRAIEHPPLYAGHAFATYFKMFTQKNIQDIQASPCPPDAKTIYTHMSRPLSEIIIFMNKYSTNMVAEMLFAQFVDPPNTIDGALYMQRVLGATLTYPKGIIIENGSGLSRRSRVTPRWFTAFLKAVEKDFTARPEIIASMGISGIDGTLKRRTKHPRLMEQIRGKTGSLKGLVTLAGIMDTPQWGRCLFTLIIEHPGIPAWKVYDVEKQIFARLMSTSGMKKN